jgi:hypothetical protein
MSINELGSRSVYAGLWFSARQVSNRSSALYSLIYKRFYFCLIEALSIAQTFIATRHAACCGNRIWSA